jgi:murein DD-endopeptidase MepM/ murein hydrolase activator NlpD
MAKDTKCRWGTMIQKTINGFRVTTEYGVIDKLHSTPHNGIDIALPEGSPLYSIGKGIVENVVNYGKDNIGQGVIVKLENGRRVIYGHISKATVQPGDPVGMGDLVALSGNTGRSTGPHLHFSVKEGTTAIDPNNVAAAAVDGNNRFIPDFIEKPYKNATDSIGELNDKLDAIGYWMNPKHLLSEGWEALGNLMVNPEVAIWLMGGTIIGAWLIMLGAKWPKKYLFWGWILYWALRGFVFV